MCDKASLRDYSQGKLVSLGDVKRRLLLLERSENNSIPDHYYRLNQEQSFGKIESLSEVFTEGLADLSAKYLEMSGNRIYVKQCMQTQWQELITYIPPLILQAAFLHHSVPIVTIEHKEILEYYSTYILPNFRFTALPHPYVPQLEHYISHSNGLHDLHMHLNGSTEIDLVWQDLLFNPDKAQNSLSSNEDNEKVKEQSEQEGLLECGMSLFEMLKSARQIRETIFNTMFPCDEKDSSPDLKSDNNHKSIQDLLQELLYETRDASIYHPFIYLFSESNKKPETWMPLEALMYVLTLRYLQEKPKECMASIFHFYLLIQGVANRMLVQQTHQFGFEQFQKVTLNDLRGNSEREYHVRFLQLHGNDYRNIRYIEGRFSPKKTQTENESLLHSINEGWEKLVRKLERQRIVKNDNLPTLNLIAHFIKEKDKDPDKYIRHKKLRTSIRDKASVLGYMLDNKSSYVKNLVAVDAASSEFDTPPEVFAPTFRFLRCNGVKHFTYHAGEDFFHIISGLRAIYEAVEFCDLRNGDRIGHATAMGVSTVLWKNCIGEKILIRQGEYMDDLVFAYHLITSSKTYTLTKYLAALESKIYELSYKIYGKSYPLSIIVESWLLRKFCPVQLSALYRENDQSIDFYNEEGLRNVVENKKEAIELLERYHCSDNKTKYDEIIEVEIEEIFDLSELELLQKCMLKYLHDKEIVIETLPTSNIRIGMHRNYTTYHLWNWMKWRKEGNSIPPIVIGTDDAGIFATNIYNEFANIYCHLTCERDMGHVETMQFLEELDKNGQIYKFSNT